MKPSLKALCAALTLILLLPGCASEDLPEEEDTTLLPAESVLEEDEDRSPLPELLSLPYDPALALDPVTCPEGMQQTIGSLLYEGLFRLDEHFQPQPWLCETFTYDAETFRYTFTLRSGITFSDGVPLTGADVKATLDRARTSPRYSQRLSAVTSVLASENTITVTLSRPNAAFPALMDIPIVKQGTENTAAPIGTGPYFFSLEENGAHLIASQSWWRGESQPTDRIALVEADGHDAMLYRFTSRDVQLIAADFTGSQSVSVTGDMELHDAATTIMQYVGINTAHLSESALRQALWLGIDRKNITNAYLSGHAAAAQFPVSPASSLYPREMESSFSINALKDALTQCAQLPQQPLTLLVNEENSFRVSVAQSIAATYTAAGLAVEVQVLPWEDYLTALERGEFDLYYGEVRLTADWDLHALLSSAGSLNYGRWSNEETDRLLELYAHAGESSAMAELCAHLKEAAPILPVCFKAVSILTQPDIFYGLSPTAAEPFYDLSNIHVQLK